MGREWPADIGPVPPGGTQSNWSDPMLGKFAQSAVEFLKKEDGPTAVEYAVMLALIIVVCIAAISTLGSSANQTFSHVGDKVKPTAS